MKPDVRGINAERARRVVFSSGVGVAQRLTQILATLVCFPFLTRSLGVEQFGIWGAATSLAWLINMLDLGVGAALVSLIPQSLAGRSEETPGDLVGAAIASAFARTLIVLAIGAGALTADHWMIGLPFTIAALALTANIPAALSGRLWLSLQMAYVASGWDLVQTMASAVLLIWGSLARWSTSALVLCVFGSILATNTLSFAHLLARHPEIRPTFSTCFRAVRKLMVHSLPMFGIAAAAIAGYAFDNVLCLAWLGAAAAAQIAIALRLCTTTQGVIDIIGQTLWPAFADASHDRGWIRRTLCRGAALLTGMSLLGAIALLLIGGPLLRLWLGRDFGLGPATLWAVGAWVTAYAIVQAPSYLLLAMSKLKALFAALATVAVGGLALKAVVAPGFGPAGVLSVTAALNLLIVLPTVLWATRDWLKSFASVGVAA